jgi:hypothetical protein
MNYTAFRSNCSFLSYYSYAVFTLFLGMCCDRGYGAYEFSLGDTLIYSSDFEKTFNDYVEHVFTVGEIYTRAPTLLPVTTSPTIKVNIGDPTMSPIPP